MSSRVPMLRGNTRDTGYLPHGAFSIDRSTLTDPITPSFFPTVFTQQQLVTCLRVKKWKISIDITFDYLPDPFFPPDDLDGLTASVSDGIVVPYVDSYTHWHDINGGAAMGVVDFPADHTVAGNHPAIQATKEYHILTNFTRDTRRFNGPDGTGSLPNTRGDIGPWNLGCATNPPDAAPRMYQQVIPEFQGTFSGTWIDLGSILTYTTSFLTWINPQEANDPDSLGTNFAPTMYDNVTGLIYPFIYVVCTLSTGGVIPRTEVLQSVKDSSSRPVVGTGTIHIPASADPFTGRPDDIDLDFSMYRSSPTAYYRFSSSTIEYTLEPLEWWAFKNSLGQEIYDTDTGDLNQIGGVPVDPFA